MESGTEELGLFTDSILPSSALLQKALPSHPVEGGTGAGWQNGQWPASCSVCYYRGCRSHTPSGGEKTCAPMPGTQSAETKATLSPQPGNVHAISGCHRFFSVMLNNCQNLAVLSLIHEQYV